VVLFVMKCLLCDMYEFSSVVFILFIQLWPVSVMGTTLNVAHVLFINTTDKVTCFS
jgi:hypothetical protein